MQIGIRSYNCTCGIAAISFRGLFDSFPLWWGKISGLTTGKFTLVIFSCFPFGFIFAETFYRFATLIGYMNNVELGDRAEKINVHKNKFQDVPSLIDKFVTAGIIKNDIECIAKGDFRSRTLVKLLLDKDIIRSDGKNPDYAYFYENSKSKLELDLTNKNIHEIGQVLDIWEQSRNNPYYTFDEKIRNEDDLKGKIAQEKFNDEEKKRIITIWRELLGIMHYKTRYQIQQNIYFQRVWDWENFQSTFCLYLESTLLAFVVLFFLSILYTYSYVLVSDFLPHLFKSVHENNFTENLLLRLNYLVMFVLFIVGGLIIHFKYIIPLCVEKLPILCEDEGNRESAIIGYNILFFLSIFYTSFCFVTENYSEIFWMVTRVSHPQIVDY